MKHTTITWVSNKFKMRLSRQIRKELNDLINIFNAEENRRDQNCRVEYDMDERELKQIDGRWGPSFSIRGIL